MRKFLKIKSGLILLIFMFCPVLAGQASLASSSANSTPSEVIYAPAVSREFYEIAYGLANSENVTYVQNELAVTFLTAAMNLDTESSDARALLLKCACRFPEQHALQRIAEGHNYFDLVHTLLGQYVDENADVDLASTAASFLASQAGSPAQKQTLVEQMLKNFSDKNRAFGARLAVMLGMLKLQDNSPQEAAQYFQEAYQLDKNNKLAFSKLVELVPQQVSPSEYLERLRLDLRENPINLQTVLAFCRSCEQMQLYDTAADGYEYCADLFSYLYPSEALPPDIYIPWSICCYNSPTRQFKCLEIAESIRKTGKFDIRLESLSGRAAGKLGENQAAAQIIRQAERDALDLINKNSRDITAAQMAWFYNFVLPIPDKAVEWSNKAYSMDPSSPISAALLAYALTQKREFSSAASLINSSTQNQISDLALGQIQLDEGQAAQGIQSLKSAVSRDPGSFAAERAKVILSQNNEEYVPAVSPDAIRTSLVNTFGNELVSRFTPPERMVSVSFNIRNRELAFGGNLDSVISITNNSSEPLMITEDSMFRGNIRVDAIISGDMSRIISNLFNTRIRDCEAIEPGESKLVNVSLVSGELRDMLMTYPQATLNISFVLYLDPVKNVEDRITNRLTNVAPVSVSVVRPGVTISGQYLRNLIESVPAAREEQKISSAQLFIGLLKEQNAFKGRTPPYHAVFSDGMDTMLKSALTYDSGLLQNPDNSDWAVKAQTVREMLSLPLDFNLIGVAAKNLYNDKWPVRLMALYLLAESQGQNFNKVLEGIARTDQNQLVRDMAAIEMQKIGVERAQSQ